MLALPDTFKGCPLLKPTELSCTPCGTTSDCKLLFNEPALTADVPPTAAPCKFRTRLWAPLLRICVKAMNWDGVNSCPVVTEKLVFPSFKTADLGADTVALVEERSRLVRREVGAGAPEVGTAVLAAEVDEADAEPDVETPLPAAGTGAD